MTALLPILAERIHRAGPMPFEAFMEAALYDPHGGYYTAGAPFGARGDFYTAAGLSGAFGRTLGRFLAQRLPALDLQPVDLLDVGAGEGRLAGDLIAGLGGAVALHRLYLVDRNTRRLPAAVGAPPRPALRVTDLAELPDAACRGAAIANELFDALPVRRLRRTRRGLEAAHVDWRDGRLIEIWRPDDDPAARAYARRYLPPAPREYTFEYPAEAAPLLRELRRVMDRGLCLIVDYGDRAGRLLAAERPGGTLRAYARHRVHGDLLADPGAQDLTADVNFDHLMAEAEAAGFRVEALVTQGRFLADNGFLEEFQPAGDAAAWRANLPLRQLLLPGGMGELFKVLVLSTA
jgi:SAM-dependent MidA family methyltransferase